MERSEDGLGNRATRRHLKGADGSAAGGDPEQPIYLDHNATTPVAEPVLEAMWPYLKDHFGNPSSGHVYGRRAKEAVVRARHEVAEFLGCEPQEVVFTSGGTESNNLAIHGIAAVTAPGRVITSTVEHPATAVPCWALEEAGFEVVRLPVDSTGRISTQEVAEALSKDTRLMTLMLANNETGTVMPIEEVAQFTASFRGDREILLHADAAQAVGKIPIDVKKLGVHLLSIAGHKLYAPKGVGALYVRSGTPLMPFLLGAGHEGGLRPGTENVAGIVGLGRACQMAKEDLQRERRRMETLRDELWELLCQAIPNLRLNGHPHYRLPNTLNVGFPGVRGSAILEKCPGVAASTGSACHEGGDESPSPVLTAMGQDRDMALEAVRLTLGRRTGKRDIQQASERLTQAYQELVGEG